MTATLASAAAFLVESLLWAASWGTFLVGVLTILSHVHWFISGWLDRRDETRLIDHAARAKADLDGPRRVRTYPILATPPAPAPAPAPTPPADGPRR